MAIAYTRLKLNPTFIEGNSDELYDYGEYGGRLFKGKIKYRLTITSIGKLVLSKNGKTVKEIIRTGVFNRAGESPDEEIEIEYKSIQEVNSQLRAYWEVFLDEDKNPEWQESAKTWFDTASAGIATRWSVANLPMSKYHSALSKPNGEQNKKVITISGCPHNSDGAFEVAKYIVQEIKTNVKSEQANLMRSYNEEFLSFMDGHATALWIAMTAKGQRWDHKPLIRQKFKNVAVHRKLPTGTWSESYYHKYKKHDYYLDVWSNIHYGYVGLSVGFKEKYLLRGASLAQISDSGGANTEDPIDDVTSIRLGFALYKNFGKFAENLNEHVLMNELESLSDSLLPASRLRHVCLPVES